MRQTIYNAAVWQSSRVAADIIKHSHFFFTLKSSLFDIHLDETVTNVEEEPIMVSFIQVYTKEKLQFFALFRLSKNRNSILVLSQTVLWMNHDLIPTLYHGGASGVVK